MLEELEFKGQTKEGFHINSVKMLRRILDGFTTKDQE